MSVKLELIIIIIIIKAHHHLIMQPLFSLHTTLSTWSTVVDVVVGPQEMKKKKQKNTGQWKSGHRQTEKTWSDESKNEISDSPWSPPPKEEFNSNKKTGRIKTVCHFH